MGKKIDALLGRWTFKASKFKPTMTLAISRLSVLKNQRRARISVSRSDVVELLNLGHHDRALIRVEQVIKEQNMLDLYVMVEGYCHLIIERLNLVEQEKGCPEDLEEAVSSLIYASTRCGEFPELQEMRAMFTSHFGKEFVARALELRNNCRVNTMVVLKLSTRQPNLESRMKVLKEIASENDISLQNKEESPIKLENESDAESKHNRSKEDQPRNSGPVKLEDKPISHEDMGTVDDFSGSMKGRKKYKDVADAAQAAFESAAYAAAAARAAVELSRSDSHDSDDHPSFRPRKVSTTHEPRLPHGQELGQDRSKIFKTHQSVYMDGVKHMANEDDMTKQRSNAKDFLGTLSGSSSYSPNDILQGTAFSTSAEVKTTATERKVVYDGSDDEEGAGQRGVSITRIHDLDYDITRTLFSRRASYFSNSNTPNDEDTSDGSDLEPNPFQKKHHFISEAASEWESGPTNPKISYVEKLKAEQPLKLDLEKRPISVRTR